MHRRVPPILRQVQRMQRRRTTARLAMAAAIWSAMSACAADGPRDLRLGEENCGYCRMTIGDARFSAQARTQTGKVHAFDSVECLADWASAAPAPATLQAWVSDFRAPGTWLAASEARFVRLAKTGSPMGRGLAAVRADATPAALAAIGVTGAGMTWEELLQDAAARRAAPAGGDTAHAHAH